MSAFTDICVRLLGIGTFPFLLRKMGKGESLNKEYFDLNMK
jgi:hypothetical protein